MKLTRLVLATLMTGATVAGSLRAADFDFHVDSGAAWGIPFVNAFNLDGSYAFGFQYGDPLSTLAADFSGPSTLTLGPNTAIYDNETFNAAWVDQGTFEPVLYIEANYFQETGFGTVAVGNTFSLQGATTTSDLGSTPWSTGPAGWSGVAFLKVLDPGNNWSTEQVVTAPLIPGQGFFLQDTVLPVTSGGDPFIQAGFALTGPIISSVDALAGTGITIVPEPTTFALAGLGAAALLIFRRRR